MLLSIFAYFVQVKYLQTVGGVNLKEAVNLYFKEVLKDDVITHCTWGGRDQHQRGLCNARIILAVYGRIHFSSVSAQLILLLLLNIDTSAFRIRFFFRRCIP